jgi:hypothetical protein
MFRVYERDATTSIAGTGAKGYFKPLARDERLLLVVAYCCNSLIVERVEFAVRAHRVVEERELRHSGDAGERSGMCDARVSPADPVRVLLVGVLRVVEEEEVRAGRSAPARDPFDLVVGRGRQIRLPVGQVGEP